MIETNIEINEPITTNNDETANPSEEVAFITGVEIDVDQWREQTVEELQGWINSIQNKVTKMGDKLVDFPEGWNNNPVMSQKQQFDSISEEITKSLKGNEAKSAMIELQAIKSQADKIRQLDKELSILDKDDDDDDNNEGSSYYTDNNYNEYENYLKVDEEMLDIDNFLLKFDTSGPNPFDFDDKSLARLKEIDGKLGIDDSENRKKPTKTICEINDELMKLYQDETSNVTKEMNNDKISENEKPKSAPQKKPIRTHKKVVLETPKSAKK
ncbi:hypothetical protein TRFO_07082 [Tritrichomonas foetus]|uniref:Uncharacterized protein n=1 Tax=Tritrichomonas foetus TaxID=1144522 RepID=A0A1J4JU30_9EUKA|nr:hypothetical protein TRFO_07082 [Tritrichomonas foetus]|eukprot:OHT02647.1 hypothetical protein TRFO_07082 [Tritrichomonas foetus]